MADPFFHDMPATPLPWKGRHVPLTRSDDCTFDVAPNGTEEWMKMARQNSAYVIHATHNYLRMVETLELIAQIASYGLSEGFSQAACDDILTRARTMVAELQDPKTQRVATASRPAIGGAR